MNTQTAPSLLYRRLSHLVSPSLGASKWFWMIVLGGLALIYLFINFGLLGMLPAALNIYMVQPVLWLGLAAIAYLGWRHGPEDRPAVSRPLLLMAAAAGAVQIAVFIIAGLLFSFGRSPYSHQLFAVLGNVWYLGAMLVGMEMSRAYLLLTFRRRAWLALLLIMLLFSFVSIPITQFGVQSTTAKVYRFIGMTIMPTLSKNLLASFLALVGGPLASTVYLGVLLAFEWLSPVLPNLNWLITAFIGTLVPALGLLIVYDRLQSKPEAVGEAQPRPRQWSTLWILVAIIAVGAVWLNTGLFGIRPSLVSGISMNPTLLMGDVVIIKEVSAEELAVGDIVRFKREGAYVVHRIKEIQRQGEEITFITRGDNNDVDDAPVPASILEGKVIGVIPKIGWVGIGFKKVIEWLGFAR